MKLMMIGLLSLVGLLSMAGWTFADGSPVKVTKSPTRQTGDPNPLLIFNTAVERVIALEAKHPLLKGISKVKPAVEREKGSDLLKSAAFVLEKDAVPPFGKPAAPIDKSKPSLYVAVRIWRDDSLAPTSGVFPFHWDGHTFRGFVQAYGSDAETVKAVQEITIPKIWQEFRARTTTHDDGHPPKKLAATLQSVRNKTQSPKEVMLRLTVENIGESPLVLARLWPRQLIMYSSWYGWDIQIDGPGGQWKFIPYPQPCPPLADHDFIDLSPGESFGLLIDIGQAAPWKQTKEGKTGSWIHMTKGEYTVTVSYTPDTKWWAHLKRADVSLIPVTSNSVKVTVE